ncbi:oligodendrocyte transcription factor 2-like [Dreissena polymorpha]|uniref:BHLH domain-containing protein n=1 Tax=Dreissena polymorpha TaxID=45954 RepID=A0A9D4I0Z4_DREPO|nr:oligodendrocyte transcription factor 2-like [Dreissena polymorpha]KAH3739867.1 hypothetical protein DPMN_046557 [Dreissena polymorpha]
MSLSYSIESLLQSSKSDVNDYVESRADVTSSVCYSDIDDNSDDEKSNSPQSLAKKLDRRFKSNVPEDVRLRVNHRERQRMHDLNSALDSLRKTLPYSHGPSVKKISKMATLVLARNYILMLNKSLEEMRKLVTDVSMKKSAGVNVTSTCGLPSDRIPTLATSLPGSHLLRTSPYLPYDKTSIRMDDVTKTSSHQPVTSHASPYLYTIPSFHIPNVACHVSGGVSPMCPCNFCQVALATLPKSDWKQTCQ